MSVVLPIGNHVLPLIRVLHRKDWRGSEASAGGWQQLMMLPDGMRLGGFELLSCSRGLLPHVGRAVLRYQFGRFGRQVIGSSAATNERFQAGATAWDSSIDSLALPDLRNHEIRIQAARDPGDDSTPAWRTVWWGYVSTVEEFGWAASGIPSGHRLYHCVDGFWRTKSWFMNRHGFYAGAGQFADCVGHPGYNVGSRVPGRLAGNMETTAATWTTTSGASARYHTWQGNAWTDHQAVDNALVIGRPKGQPLWKLSGATGLFAGENAWPVSDKLTVWDFVNTVCRRGRGLGAVLPTWDDDSGSPLGALTCRLQCFAQIAPNIAYINPVDGGLEVIEGATALSTTTTVDIIGDHRLIDGSLSLGDAEKYRVDYLETEGEQIEVMVTLGNIDGTLVAGWTDAESAAFRDLASTKRTDERYNQVYHLQRLSRAFDGSVGNGNGGGNSSANYGCSDSGAITAGATGFSPVMIEVLNELPAFEGYSYVGATPVRWDAQAESAFAGQTTRLSALPWIRTKDGRYRRPEDPKHPKDLSLRVQFLRDGIVIGNPSDYGTGQRVIGDTAYATLASAYAWSAVVITVGIRLANRVRMASGNAAASRRMKIPGEELHLWLAHPGAIWDLQGSTENSDGFQPRRDAGAPSAGYGILRDDRDKLARRHHLAVAWYGPIFESSGAKAGNRTTASDRRSVSYALRDCALLDGFVVDGGALVAYPQLGHVITQIDANGQRLGVNTPLSVVTYDHQAGVSSLATDWADLEMQ